MVAEAVIAPTELLLFPPGSKMKFAPLKLPRGSKVDFGIEVHGAELDRLTDEEFEVIRRAVYAKLVVVFKNQKDLAPATQEALNRAFDPTAEGYGHGNDLASLKESILKTDIHSLPVNPAVKLLGNGTVHNQSGMQGALELKHPQHHTFHKSVVSEDRAKEGVTRFFRWHMDAALYAKHLPKVTTLLALQVPKGRSQEVHYDDGTGAILPVSLGATAFVSGQAAFRALTPEQRRFALRSKVKYGPHPYLWIKRAKAHPTGLTIESEGKELQPEELPKVEEDKIMIYPMVWKNPLTGAPSLQLHGCCVLDIITDGVPMGDLKKVREKALEMMRPGIEPSLVYAHNWEVGDMVLFNNQGLWHTILGTLTPEDVRVYHQCNLAASEPPTFFKEMEVQSLLQTVEA